MLIIETGNERHRMYLLNYISMSSQAAYNYQYSFFKTDIDECASSPCTNGATCSNQVNSYSCICAAGYTGAKCETGNVVLLTIYLSTEGTVPAIADLDSL